MRQGQGRVRGWGGAQAAEGVRPASISPCGNYAVQILWDDGFNQVTAAPITPALCR